MSIFFKAYWLSILIATLSVLCALFGYGANGLKRFFGDYGIVIFFIIYVELGLLTIHAGIFCLLSLPLYWYFKPRISLLTAVIYGVVICEISLLGYTIFVLHELASGLRAHFIFVTMGVLIGLLFHFFYKYFEKRLQLKT